MTQRHSIANLRAASLALACSAHAALGQTRDVADMDLSELVQVRVSPFEVSTAQDRGYRASNAVSGTRLDAPIQDLPFAIQAFTEAFIRDQKPVNIHDIARYAPGVTYRSNDFFEGNANLAIRGFAVGFSAGNTQILRDGMHGPSIFDFTNISRVEVVKGPTSFLYGQLAPGGIVNIITKSPQARFAANGQVGIGSYGQYRAEADVTGPLAERLYFRVAGSYDQDLHYWRPYDAHSSNISPSLLWQPNERVSVALKAEDFRKVERPQVMQKPTYSRQVGVLPTAADPNRQGVEVPGLPDDWNSMSNHDFRLSRTRALSGWVDLKLDPNWMLRASAAHQFFEVDLFFSGNLGMANNSTFLQGRRVRRQTYTNWGDTLEAQAVGRYRWGDTSLRVLLGAQHMQRRFDNVAGQAPNDPALGNNPTASPLPLWDLRDPSTWNRERSLPLTSLTAVRNDRRTDATDDSLYGGVTIGLFDERLLVLAGWRRTDTASQVEVRLNQTLDPKFSASRVTPQYGLLYKARPGVSLFASYAESFVPSSLTLNRPDGSVVPATPTHGQGWDLGVKAELWDGRVSGTLSLFDLRNKNIINDIAQTNAAGTVVIQSVQSGEQRSRGVELDTTIALAAHWQLYLSYSFMDARIVEFSGNDAAILALDPTTLDAAGQANYKNVSLLHGARLQMSAPHLANLWTRYDITQGGLRGAYLAGGVNVVRDQTILPDGPPSTRQSYTLVNALVGYGWGSGRYRHSLELMGKNLSDARYRPSQSTRSRPREFLLTLRAGF